MTSIETLIAECIFEDDHKKIFRDNNRSMPLDQIDLHGLSVDEAQAVFIRRLEIASKNGNVSLRFITGRGNRSPGGVPKIRTAIEGLCDELNLYYRRSSNEVMVFVYFSRAVMASCFADVFGILF